MTKKVNKVFNTGKVNQRRVKRVLKDNKAGLSLVGGVATVLTVGAGILGMGLAKKKAYKDAKSRIDELETENQRLETLLVNLSESHLGSLGIEDVDDLEDYVPNEDLDTSDDSSAFGFPDFIKFVENEEETLGDNIFALLQNEDDSLEPTKEELDILYPEHPEELYDGEREHYAELENIRAEWISEHGDELAPPYESEEDESGESLEDFLNAEDEAKSKESE